MPKGGTLRVEIDTSSLGERKVRVRDTGPGISAAVRSRLFEPFVTSKETGVGLGLVVSRRIAEDHGGSLRLLIDSGPGACFELCLPIRRSTPAAANGNNGKEAIDADLAARR